MARIVRMLGLWLALTGGGTSAASAAPDLWSWPTAAEQQPHPAVVRIVTQDANGMSLGSGTLVDVRDRYGLVVTNWHVVRDARGAIHVVFPDGFRSAAEVLKTDRHWDLAALVIWRPAAEPLPLAERGPRPGEVLTIAGYGSGSYRSASGRCTQYLAPSRHHPYELVELSAAARQGDSGGPIINQQGQLAGVLFGSAGGTTSGSYAPRVRQFLAAAWPLQQPPSADPRHLADRAPRQTQPGGPPTMTEPGRSTSGGGPGEGGVSARGRQLASQGRRDTGGQRASAEPMVRLPWVGKSAGGSRPDSVARTPTPQIPRPKAPGSSASELVASQPSQPVDQTLGWSDLAGHSPWEQLKTVLALIGLGAVLVQLTRWLSPQPQ